MSKHNIWLSHILGEDTPTYAGNIDSRLRLEPDKQISCNDSCNTSILTFSNHLGSHVDAPKHFIETGNTIDDYQVDSWIFKKPLLINVKASDSEILCGETMEKFIHMDIDDADLVLIKTGYEQYRKINRYWESAPGFSSELCQYFQKRFRSFRAIGMDTISISSLSHRELGREAHRKFLGEGILIFEDLKLSDITSSLKLIRVIALPLRFKHADGAPVTMYAEVTSTNE